MTNFTVTTLTDENDSGATVATPLGTGLSLREAITLANGNAGADTITFATGAGTIRLASTLTVTDSLTINGDVDGNHTADITITGDVAGDDVTPVGGITDLDLSAGHLGDNVLIFIATEDITLDGLVLTGGVAGGSGAAVDAAPGADVTLIDSTVSGNASTAAGGAIRATNATLTRSIVSGNHSGDVGGAIVVDDAVHLTDSIVRDDSADGDGGGIYAAGSGTSTVINSTVSGNDSGGAGGGLNIGGTAEVTNSTISGNRSDGAGGGLLATTAVLTNVTVSGNHAVTETAADFLFV